MNRTTPAFCDYCPTIEGESELSRNKHRIIRNRINHILCTEHTILYLHRSLTLSFVFWIRNKKCNYFILIFKATVICNIMEFRHKFSFVFTLALIYGAKLVIWLQYRLDGFEMLFKHKQNIICFRLALPSALKLRLLNTW